MSKSKLLPYLDPALCGLAEGAEILGDRWVLLIFREAFYGVARFETVLSYTHIVRQTLTTRSKAMTETGLFNKVPYQGVGSRERYEYVLTDKNRSLALVLFALIEWGHQHVLHSAPHIALVDSISGEAVHPGFITISGTVTNPAAPQIVRADECQQRRYRTFVRLWRKPPQADMLHSHGTRRARDIFVSSNCAIKDEGIR